MRIYPRRHARGGALCTSPATPMVTTPEAWAGKLSHFRGGLSNLPATERGTYVRDFNKVGPFSDFALRAAQLDSAHNALFVGGRKARVTRARVPAGGALGLDLRTSQSVTLVTRAGGFIAGWPLPRSFFFGVLACASAPSSEHGARRWRRWRQRCPGRLPGERGARRDGRRGTARHLRCAAHLFCRGGS